MGNNYLSLFKFYSFNWFFDKHAEENKSFFIDSLKRRYIYCQDIDKLNDAFENKSILVCSLAKNDRDLKAKKKIVIDFLKSFKSNGEKTETVFSIKEIKRSSLSDFNGKLKYLVESYQKSINSRSRVAPTVSCFTKRNNNALMWGHYANGMTGVCIEYKVNEVLFEKTFLKVRYSEKVNEINAWDFFAGKSDYIGDWHSTKSKIWEYEEEVRVVRHSSTRYLGLEESHYLNICFGCKCSLIDVKLVLDVIGKWNEKPSISIAYPVNDSFDVEIVEYENRAELISSIIEYKASRQIVNEIRYS